MSVTKYFLDKLKVYQFFTLQRLHIHIQNCSKKRTKSCGRWVNFI